MIFILEIWRKLNWQPRLIIICAVIVLCVFGFQYCRNSITQTELQNEINRQKEADAQKSKQEVDEAINKSEQSANKTKEIIKTDSNKFSTNAEDKFCSYMCAEKVDDSSCVEWRKRNNIATCMK
jgi:hypothetical protein